MFTFNTILSGIDFKVRKLIENYRETERELTEVKQENQKLKQYIEHTYL